MKKTNRAAAWTASILVALPLVAAVGQTGIARGATARNVDMARHAFGPGETFEFRVRYGFLETGRATVEIGREIDVDAGEVWPIKMDARTTRAVGRLYDLNTNLVSHYLPEQDTTLGFDRDNIERGESRETRVRLEPDSKRAHVVRKRGGEIEEERTYQVGSASHDIMSAIFWLRDRPLNVGDVETVRIFTGRKSWDLTATVMRAEITKTQWGHVRTKRIRLRTHFEGEAAARRDIEIWMTEEPHHIPVAIRADLALGSLRADLRDYVPPIPSE